MRRTTLAAVVMALATAGHAATDFIDTAQVISSTPIVERVSEPRQVCGPAAAAAPAPAPERSLAGPIVGGIAGAILGSQVGRGNGRTAAAAAGAVAGTLVGDRVANPESDGPMTGAVVGGAAGGLLGAQVGRGSGRNAAAAAGAVAGAVAGDRVQNPQRAASAPPAQQCRTVEDTREVIKGYTVVYHYSGRDATATLPYDPGTTVRVGVGIVDSASAAGASGSVVTGTNVRDVSPAKTQVSGVAPEPAAVRAGGGYQYRY